MVCCAQAWLHCPGPNANRELRLQGRLQALPSTCGAVCSMTMLCFAGGPALRGSRGETFQVPTRRPPSGPSRQHPWSIRGVRHKSAAAAYFGEEVFTAGMHWNEVVAAGLASGAATPALLPVIFAAGIVSSVNPCSAAALPAAAASVAALAGDRAGVAMQALAYAAGSGTVLAGIGLVAASAGERLPVGEGVLQWLFPLIAVAMGLTLLGIVPLRVQGLTGLAELPNRVPRELQGFLLGAVSAAGSSPCATPVLVTVTSYLAANPQGTVSSAALLLAYALGYNTPLALVSLSADLVLPWLQRGSLWGPRLGGAAILAVGTGQLISAASSVFGSAVAEGLMLAVFAVAGALAFAFQEQLPMETAVPAAVVQAVPNEDGVYRYSPSTTFGSTAGTPSAGVALPAGVDAEALQARRTALASVCGGVLFAGAQRLLPSGGTRETAADILREMARRSAPLAGALRSGRPVVVDFSATWCVECLELAPRLRDLEEQYRRNVEFVTLDVSTWRAAPAGAAAAGSQEDIELDWWVRQFRVDMLPHVAFVAPEGRVITALVGNLPAVVLGAEIEALAARKELPYAMYDAFDGGRRRLEWRP